MTKNAAPPVVGAMPSDLKLNNRMAVLNAFRDGGEYTANDIAEKTGISRQTVMKAIQFFIDKQLVDNIGKGASTDVGGKKPDLYTIAVTSLLLSVTMWPSNLSLTLSDMRGRRIGLIRIDAPIPSAPEEAFGILRQHATDLLGEHGYTFGDLYGVTLSTSGIIDYKKGLLRYSSQSPGWGTNIPVKQYLQDIFGDGVAIVVENAGKMTGRAALLEKAYADKRIVVIFSTWGLSACFIEKSHILSGLNSLIGEIGHMTIDPCDEDVCGCGSKGCLEQLVSTRRIRNEIAAQPEAHKKSALGHQPAEEITIADLFAASAKEDAFARQIVKKLAEYFAIALRNITLNFDPDLVVFQGNYSSADEYFCSQVKQQLGTFQYFPPNGPFEMKFDTRPLFNLDVLGSLNCLHDLYFQQPALYQD